MSLPCLLVTLFAKRTLGVCADLAAEAIPAFTDAGEFGAGEFTPGKQARYTEKDAAVAQW